MKFNLKSLGHLALFCGSFIAGSAIAVSSAQAATFAFSEAEVEIFDFSHSTLDLGTVTDTDTIAIAPKGFVATEAIADADFISDQETTYATNLSISQAQGEGDRYFGLAQSFAGVIGNFFVGAQETFAFSFNGALGLAASSDNPRFERASATGLIALQLYNSLSGELLDFFELFGSVGTFEGGDLPGATSSAFFTTNVLPGSSSDGFTKLAFAQVQGQYARSFNAPTYLTLVEVKQNQVQVETTPEASNTIGLFACVGLMGMGLGMKSAKKKLATKLS